MTTRSRWVLPCVLFLLCAARMPLAQQEREFVISNPLGLEWPWDLVHVDVADGTFTGDVSARIGDDVRPAQIERATAPDERGTNTPVQRAWFMATIPAGQKGRNTRVTLLSRRTDSPLQVERGNGIVTVRNGVYEMLLPDFTNAPAAPTPLERLAAPIAGLRLAGGGACFAGSRFTGSARVVKAETRVGDFGPVFGRVRITYRIESAASAPGTDAAERFYSVQFTFVHGDPWIDVVESYRVDGQAGYDILLSQGLPVDTVMWVPWFGWQQFGGNNRLAFAAPRAQPRQQGAFATLQPVWTQAPGHAQEFFVTTGGSTPESADAQRPFAPSAYDPEAPALGLVAVRPTRWLAPYQQRIECYAVSGALVRASLPLRIGSRAYALCAGPRRLFDSTERLNGLVRRHADWTLDEQANRAILEWPRSNPSGGPSILISRARLDAIRADVREKRDTPVTRLLAETEGERTQISGDEMDLMRLLRGEPVPARPAPGADMWLRTRFQDDFLNPTTHTRRISRALPWADLTADGRPTGNAMTAALGYIFSNPDQWPGWINGWNPGNPNFHTDKYQVAILVAAMLRDHPHAGQWLTYGRRCFEDDIARTLIAPDGVGYECPGYSTYSLGLQLEIARVFQNLGLALPAEAADRFRRTGVWHRHLLTPVDSRIGIRHQAPIGDTHRWGENDGRIFGLLAMLCREGDPAFASEMMGVWQLFRGQGAPAGLAETLFDVDHTIAPAPVAGMDWGSRAFFGFGAVMRSRFGADRETFVTLKAGPARGHYHNDELTLHVYGAGAPLALDYNCSYGPRGDHAALHNGLTLGRAGTVRHEGADADVAALEQPWGTGCLGAFVSRPCADLAVAERSVSELEMRPPFPRDAKYGYRYPRRAIAPAVHRRFVMLVKHPADSPLNDYLVVRDEAGGDEPRQINVHLLARRVEPDAANPLLLRAAGQLNTDALLSMHVPDAPAGAPAPEVSVRCWYYGAKELDEGPVREETGAAVVIPEGHAGTWTRGEFQKWVRVELAPPQTALWVLYPLRRGEPEPRITAAGDAIEVRLGEHADSIAMASRPAEGRPQAAVTQDGATHVLLDAGALAAPGSFAQQPLPGGR